MQHLCCFPIVPPLPILDQVECPFCAFFCPSFAPFHVLKHIHLYSYIQPKHSFWFVKNKTSHAAKIIYKYIIARHFLRFNRRIGPLFCSSDCFCRYSFSHLSISSSVARRYSSKGTMPT